MSVVFIFRRETRDRRRKNVRQRRETANKQARYKGTVA
jgi:hypothetical protein